MEQNNCSVCGAPVKVIPAGISKKSGKPYNAFYKCESCGKTGNVGGYSKPSYPKPYTPPADLTPRDEKMAEGQSFGNAKNVAGMLLSASIQSGQLKLEDALKQFPEVVQAIYDCDKPALGINDF